MNNLLDVVLAFIVMLGIVQAAASLVDYVNVLAGTSNTYELSTGSATPLMGRPFGFNHWSVQTEPDHAPKRYFDPASRSFYGVRCTHQPSVWLGDYGYFLVNAIISHDEPQQSVSFAPLQTTYKPHYFKSSALYPGNADMGGARIEMTPTEHAAIFRFSFPPKVNSAVLVRLFDYNSSTPVVLDKEGRFSAQTSVNNGGVLPGFAMFINGAIDPPPARMRNVDGSIMLEYDAAENNKRLSVHLRIATSFISNEQAQVNLARELPWCKNFDTFVKEGEDVWQTRLSLVTYDTVQRNSNFLRTFYTNFYRTMLFPRLLGEYDQNNQLGHYSVYTGKVVPGELATDSGFWDAYRTVYLWLSVAAPDILDRLLEGWVNAYKEAGWLPTWASPGQRGSMVGTMGDVVFGWAIIANKTPHLADDMYAAIRKDAFVERPKNSQFGREGLSAYSDRGYIPVKSNVSEVVSRGLNFAEADSVIAAAASKLGHYSDASVLYSRAQNALEMSFNTESKLFEPLEASGNWISPFDPSSWSAEFFTEASARQYRFYAPFNVDFLITKYGGREALCEHLENHFSEQVCPVYTSDYRGIIHEETELGLTSEDFGQYGHNNQPSHHVLGIAVAAQCFHVADKYMEKVLTELYTPDGWSGDEDNGEMAAWYMLNSLGFYIIDFAKDELLLFAPLVKGNYTISLLGEKTAVRVENVDLSGGHASSRPYVCEVRWYPLCGNINAAELELDSARSVRGLTRIPEPVDYVVLETRRLARADFVKGGCLVYFTSASRC